MILGMYALSRIVSSSLLTFFYDILFVVVSLLVGSKKFKKLLKQHFPVFDIFSVCVFFFFYSVYAFFFFFWIHAVLLGIPILIFQKMYCCYFYCYYYHYDYHHH